MEKGYRRRTTIELVGTLLATTSLIGCVGDSTDETDPTATPKNEQQPSGTESVQRELRIRNVQPVDAVNGTIGMLHRETANKTFEAGSTGEVDLPPRYLDEGPAVARADAVELDGEWYDPSYESGEGRQSNYKLRFRRPEEVHAEPPGEADTVVDYADLPHDQQTIAEEALDGEYVVDWGETRSDAFKAVSDVEYLQYDGDVHARVLFHGDRNDPASLELQPTDPNADDRRFHLERAVLWDEDSVEWFESNASTTDPIPVSDVPEELRAAAREYEYCSFATDLYSLTISSP